MVRAKYHARMTTILGTVALATILLPGRASSAQPAPKPRPPAAKSKQGDDVPDLTGRPRPFAESCFVDFQNGSGGFTEEDAAGWLEPVHGHPLKLVESANSHGRAVDLTGLARLRSPWTADTVLRLSVDSTSPLKLHFWQPGQGVALCYYRGAHWRSWVAYRTTCPPTGQMMIGDEQHVVSDPGLALLATDERRSGRTASGTYAIRHQNGALIVTKGDIRLLTVPMDAPPDEVYFEGTSALLRDIAVYRGEPAPEEPIRKRPIVMHGDQPAALHWKEGLPPGATLRRLSNGRVKLSTQDTTAFAWASVPLIRPGLYEVILQVEEPSPGTGVYLGDDEGRPVQAIGFFRDPRNGLIGFGHDQLDTAPTAASLNIDTDPAPYAGRRQWLRLVLACGTLKCWTSGDGTHWGRALPPAPNARGFYSHVGLYSRPGKPVRSITLRRLQVRRLDAISSLAPLKLQEQAERLGLVRRGEETVDLGAWQQRVWESQPSGTAAARWRRACAIATLIGGARPRLANGMIDGLLEDGLSSSSSVEDKLRLLQDATLLYNAWASEDAARLRGHYERLSWALLCDGDDRGFNAVRRALMTVPLWTQDYRVEAISGDLVRAELVALACREKWQSVHRLCRQLRFWNQGPNPTSNWPAHQVPLRDLVDWVQPQASRLLPKEPGKQTAAMPATWRHPLIVHSNKEAYNTCADLRVAVEEKSYRTACKVLGAAADPADWGLVADAKDGRHYVSVPTVVALAMQEHPGLRQAMGEQLGGAHGLRLQRAMAESDVRAIRGATLQYYGSPAAVEAHCWLGDRFMADGQFGRAISHYKQTLPTAAAAQQHQLAARIRLAGALLGRDMGEPVGGPVDFRSVQLSAERFEELVSATLERHAGKGASLSNTQVAACADPAPPPAAFQRKPWAAIAGDVGTNPAQVPPPAVSLDWPARQLAVAVVADMMIVTNRFQVVAHELATGQVKWTYSLGERQERTHAWSLVPMRPAVAGGRVFVRMLAKGPRPEIVCLDFQTGVPLWTGRDSRYALSDPFVIDGRLLAATTDSRPGEPTSQLLLTALDPHSGAIQNETPLAEVRRRGNLEHICQATVADDKIVATIDGGLLCVGAFGQIHWVRRDIWIPPQLDPNRARQHHQPPRVADNRVYVTQPGMPGVECVDLNTGRLHWREAVTGIRRLLELANDRLLIETDGGIQAMSAQTGHRLWQHKAEHLLNGYLRTGPAGLLFAERQSVGTDQWCPVLVWLDPATGRPSRRWPLRGLISKRPAVGPLVAHGNRVWCFEGILDEKGVLRAQRNIVELLANGPALPCDCQTPVAWASKADNIMRSATEITLPGWSLLSGAHDQKTGLQPQLAGRPSVLVTKAADTPTRLARRVSVPHGGRPRLLMDIGHDPETKSTLEIRAEGLTLLQLAPKPTTTSEPWQQVEVDLSAYGGRDVWMTVVQRQAGQTPAYLYWKRLEVIP